MIIPVSNLTLFSNIFVYNCFLARADCPALSFVFVCWHTKQIYEIKTNIRNTNEYQKYKPVELGDQLFFACRCFHLPQSTPLLKKWYNQVKLTKFILFKINTTSDNWAVFAIIFLIRNYFLSFAVKVRPENFWKREDKWEPFWFLYLCVKGLSTKKYLFTLQNTVFCKILPIHLQNLNFPLNSRWKFSNKSTLSLSYCSGV